MNDLADLIIEADSELAADDEQRNADARFIVGLFASLVPCRLNPSHEQIREHIIAKVDDWNDMMRLCVELGRCEPGDVLILPTSSAAIDRFTNVVATNFSALSTFVEWDAHGQPTTVDLDLANKLSEQLGEIF